MNETNKDYQYKSHTHCWNNKNLPCGKPLEKHSQCCLCDMKIPNETNKEWYLEERKIMCKIHAPHIKCECCQNTTDALKLLSQKDTEWKERVLKAIPEIMKIELTQDTIGIDGFKKGFNNAVHQLKQNLGL